MNQYEAYGIKFRTVPAYNLEKKFHKRKKNWVGYILNVDGAGYYFAGDTDYIPEMDEIKADVVFLPVGGTYTMNAQEAAQAANSIKPKIAIPIHFGSIVGSQKDAEVFIENLAVGIEAKILLGN
jgi:L-ascorbate metabolism protein UlaG (beta-lactamase superfamily)